MAEQQISKIYEANAARNRMNRQMQTEAETEFMYMLFVIHGSTKMNVGKII